MTPTSPTSPSKRVDPASALFDEGSIRAALAALQAATERATTHAAIAVDMTRSENVRLGALLQMAEDAQQAATSASRLGLDSRYLAGFLMGAGVRLGATP